jgi:hypothetical protein
MVVATASEAPVECQPVEFRLGAELARQESHPCRLLRCVSLNSRSTHRCSAVAPSKNAMHSSSSGIMLCAIDYYEPTLTTEVVCTVHKEKEKTYI